ncbi:hypothetical protein SAMN05192563_1024154 [Paraburkholderia aspalathi]|uniref:Uncharacterized protein n=2 Tax=Paraburkholderia aspalathi TaxID=1324617 RepID=A0A1I7EJK3_9BURK|nr:hypothetical protein SAMN05192563_1024154 [Paraburkholderia aspalathi]
MANQETDLSGLLANFLISAADTVDYLSGLQDIGAACGGAVGTLIDIACQRVLACSERSGSSILFHRNETSYEPFTGASACPFHVKQAN